jgi:hypothetical protein
MAKTIIIIEDIDTKTDRFEVKVLKFQTPEEQAGDDTAAIVIGDEVAAAMALGISKMMKKKTDLPMQSAARH